MSALWTFPCPGAGTSDLAGFDTDASPVMVEMARRCSRAAVRTDVKGLSRLREAMWEDPSMRDELFRDARHSLGSVANALRVLRLVHEHGSVTLRSVSDHLAVGKSTAHRLMTTLAAEGFLQRTRTRQSEYIAGPALLEIGTAAVRRVDVRRQARRPMERLCDLLGETVSLVMLEGNTIRVVEGVESRRTVRVALRTGVVLPSNATAAGKVLLAQMSEDELAGLFPRGLPSLTAATTATWPALRAQLKQVRSDDFAFSPGESEPGLHGLAVPVRDASGKAIAALALAAPHYRLGQRSVPSKVQALRDAAAAISRTLS